MTDGPGAAPARRRTINPILKLVLELGPLALFFIAYSRLGLFGATGVMILCLWVLLFSHCTRPFGLLAHIIAASDGVLEGDDINYDWAMAQILFSSRSSLSVSTFEILLSLANSRSFLLPDKIWSIFDFRPEAMLKKGIIFVPGTP